MVIIPGRPRHPVAGHGSRSWPSLGIPAPAARTAAYSGVDAGLGILIVAYIFAMVTYRRRICALTSALRAGHDAATFQIVLSGIRTAPQRPPHNAFAAGFSSLALARRRRQGRRR
jgi:hypothetical protein